MTTILQTAEWIESHLNQKINSYLLEEISGYTSRHLHTLFKKYIGTSVANYIRCRKLTLASVMLRETSRTATEIALMYHFDHLQTFSRAFKKQFGLSPLQYSKANYWDMRLYYPSAIVHPFNYIAQNIKITENIYISPSKIISYKIDYGYNFLISAKDNKINSYPKIYQDCINLIFSNHSHKTFIAFGEILPGKNCDSIINIYTGQITSDDNRAELLPIPKGNYCCFTYVGTPHEIMPFLSWAKGHGMYYLRKFLKKGPSFTIFSETNISGKYVARCHIPCLDQ
ncbi:helix-turn-helix domain-containing protein [Salmonella enterica subsp. enterica serovar Hull]|uniref:Helix-turn-helix domain-containing protein n=1 Tax=Salmonella enterica subsp. enterica serovar Hull TaxID=1403564 RepID=A0A5X4PKS8_SALET|nr:hypothetical protein [Salmonella enterica subsp. enterica serovar Putten]EBZ7588353.1 helix-turn-helix domain-containing protein [Salmonella enterica subsp. enterica serovar Hull]EBZ8650731.1 helix-turn-helix domain-containing protein [Salmonella enterica subsp. enterica serovar Hull]EEB7450858.1 helix-turn-helix domain-containing protein [Salmonella enterica subsp. enterica serovar Emek]